MKSIRYAIYMIKPGMFLASLDIKDAFYSIAVHKTPQKFLRRKALRFSAVPNGYVDVMQVFNKVLNPPFAYLREQGLSHLYMWMIHYWEVILLINLRTMFSVPLHS